MNKTFFKAYTGRHGCMCGCKGKWSYASTCNDIPYYMLDAINDRSVKVIVGKILRNPNHVVDEAAQCIYVELENRQLVAYWS